MRSYCVYILASGKYGTLYIGVTNELYRRIPEHKGRMIEGFTKKYNVNQLVYFEESDDITTAIEREKQLKNWKRDWKIKLIESVNPQWNDLYDELIKE
jgi:putative endonuclease